MSADRDGSHYGEELQDLLDHRLDPERAAKVTAHLERCQECRVELDMLAWAQRAVKQAPQAEVPPALEASILEALALEGAPRWSRRSLLTAAGGLVIGAGGVAWLAWRPRESLPAAVARDYRRYRGGELALESRADRADALEAFFRERGLPFRARVIDLAMMRYRLVGGRRHELGRRPAAFFVYEGDGGRTLVCQMFAGRLDELPAPAQVREHRGFRFQVYRDAQVTAVFWQEGEIVCVLAGDLPAGEVLALALEKAML